LARTLAVFAACPDIHSVSLVVPGDDMAFARSLIPPLLENGIKIQLATGGNDRQESVYNGLKSVDCKPDEIVAIHDGVRPFVTPEMISRTIEGAQRNGACIAAVRVVDTLKKADINIRDRIDNTLDREHVWAAQTPQSFRFELIRTAHEKAIADGYAGTDDASLLEHFGYPVFMVHGSRLNIKITTPEDLALAKIIDSGGFGDSIRNV